LACGEIAEDIRGGLGPGQGLGIMPQFGEERAEVGERVGEFELVAIGVDLGELGVQGGGLPGGCERVGGGAEVG